MVPGTWCQTCLPLLHPLQARKYENDGFMPENGDQFFCILKHLSSFRFFGYVLDNRWKINHDWYQWSRCLKFSESFFERVVRNINVLQPVSLWSCFSRFFVHICVRNPLILLFSPNFSSGWNILQLLPPHFFSSLKHLAKLTFTFVTVNQCHVKVFCSIYSFGSLLQILF